jgi:hypothetical protein
MGWDGMEMGWGGDACSVTPLAYPVSDSVALYVVVVVVVVVVVAVVVVVVVVLVSSK